MSLTQQYTDNLRAIAENEVDADILAHYASAIAKREQKLLALYASDVARAVGLLEGLGYPDRLLTESLDAIRSEL